MARVHHAFLQTALKPLVPVTGEEGLFWDRSKTTGVAGPSVPNYNSNQLDGW